MKTTYSFWMIASILFAMMASAAERKVLHGHVPEAVARFHLQPTRRLAASQRMVLTIGLPLRNQAALDKLLEQIYAPASPNYYHYMTPEEFTRRFGPSPNDYQAVADFAHAHHLGVTATHPNRMLLDVEGTVADVEAALHIKMLVYRHPIEAREFYAPKASAVRCVSSW